MSLLCEIVTILFGLYYCFGFLALVVLTVVMYYVHWIPFLICLLYSVYEVMLTFNGGEYKIRFFKKSFIADLSIKMLLKYFPMKLHVSDEIRDEILENSKKRKIIIGNHPHGVMAISPHVFESGDYELKRLGLDSLRFKKLAARVMFKIPMTRQINKNWFDSVDASRKVAEKVMESKNWHMYIMVGGEREQLLGQKDPNYVYVKNRKGFIRLAMKYGACIVPTYCFGETELYRTNWFTGLFMGIRTWIVKKFGVSCIIPLGNLLVPILPIRAPMDVVMGKPIVVVKVRDEKDLKNDELIKEYLQMYIDGLEEVFEKNKEKFGFEGRKLKIV